MQGRNETPFPSFSALLLLSVYVTRSALGSRLNGKGVRSATRPAWDLDCEMAMKAFSLHKVLWGHAWGLSATRRDTQHSPSLQGSRDGQLKTSQSLLLHSLEKSCVDPAHLSWCEFYRANVMIPKVYHVLYHG